VVLVSWQINDDDDDDDDDDAYGNYEHVHGSTIIHSTGQVLTCNNNRAFNEFLTIQFRLLQNSCIFR